MKYTILGILACIVGSQLSGAIRSRDLLAVETRGSILTMTELAVYIAGSYGKAIPPVASRAELLASPIGRPDYIVVGVRPAKPVNITGVLAVKIDGKVFMHLPVAAHRGPHWVEYFIPRDGDTVWEGPLASSPKIELEWIKLTVK